MAEWLQIHKRDYLFTDVLEPICNGESTTLGLPGLEQEEGFRAFLNLVDGRTVLVVGIEFQNRMSGPAGRVSTLVKFPNGDILNLGRSDQNIYWDTYPNQLHETQPNFVGVLLQVTDDILTLFDIR